MTPRRWTVILLLLVSSVCAGVAVYQWSSVPVFPTLSPGTYVGEITGLSASRGEAETFFLERLERSHSYLIVVFIEGFKPQAIISPEVGSEEGSPVQPLPMTVGQEQLFLEGSAHGDRAEGSVRRGDARIGRWKLRRIDTADLSLPIAPPFDLREWLVAKVRFRSLKDGLARTEIDLSDRTEKVSKLSTFLRQEEVLRVRATNRRDALQAELKIVIGERKASMKKVQDLVNELQLQSRISRQGRAVELVRRVAKRENDWYMANWGAGEDVSDVERLFSAHPEIDPRRLEAEVRRANEVRGLLREVQAEREKIRSLEVSPPLEKAPKQNDEKSLWNTIF